MAELQEFLEVLDLTDKGDGRFGGRSLSSPTGVVFGGQLMGQSIVAASRSQPGKRVTSIHTIFARAGRLDADLEFEVDTMHAGRGFGSLAVTARQGDRLCCRSMLLMAAEEPDVIRHQAQMPAVAGPDAATPLPPYAIPGEMRIGGGADIVSPDAVGPAELEVWFRCPGVPDDDVLNQALLADASDPMLIGTAMRPHAGVGMAQAHVTVDTGVLSHTLTFHEPVRVGEWLLLQHESPHAGRGLTFGRAQVFTQSGRLVASFGQENMVRAMPKRG